MRVTSPCLDASCSLTTSFCSPTCSEPNLGIIPEEWKRKSSGHGEEKNGGGRVRRNSIRLSERGKVIDIVSLIDGDEETKNQEESKSGNQNSIVDGISKLMVSRNVVLDAAGRAGGEQRVFNPNFGGGSKQQQQHSGYNRRRSPAASPGPSPLASPSMGSLDKKHSETLGAGPVIPLTLQLDGIDNLSQRASDDYSGYSSSESVSSINSEGLPITRKKKRREKRQTTGGLDDVIEESVGNTTARDDMSLTPHEPFGGEVREISTDIIQFCCCSSGDLGHWHTPNSTWIPTGMFPQSCVIGFKRKIDVSKVLVDCSGAKKLRLIVDDGENKEYESPEMPPCAIMAGHARQTDIANLDILDTPRETVKGGDDLGGLKKFWSAGHLGPQHSPSPGVVNVSSNSGVWATHVFNVQSGSGGWEETKQGDRGR